MIEEQEIGRITARLAIADESFLGVMIQSAKNAGQRMMPEDVATLEKWAVFIQLLKTCLEGESKEATGE